MVSIRILVTSALPYVNNVPHLGTIVGCVLPADVFARYCRLAGHETLYICGTDEHGTPITVAAMKEGATPKALCDKYYAEHKHVYDWFNISFDNFSRTTKPIHYDTTQELFKRMNENGYVIEKEMEVLYCPKCEKYLPDRYVEGTCPHCGFVGARGDQCDSCCRIFNSPVELKEPYCNICKGRNLETRKTKHLFIDLPKLAPKLEKWVQKNTHWPDNARNWALGVLKGGLIERCITRDMKWGVPVLRPGFEEKVFYVWFDAPIGYISSTKEWAEKNDGDWEKWWKDKKTKIYQFMGKDNISFHTVFFPGMLMAAKGYILPYRVCSFEFLNYKGERFSKSRGVGIFGNDAMAMGYPSDFWRFALLSMLPEKQDSDFTPEEFRRRVNDELIDIICNLVNRALTFTAKNFDAKVPKCGELAEEDKVMLERIDCVLGEVSSEMKEVRLKEALKKIVSFAKDCNAYFNAKAPWVQVKADKAKAATTLNICIKAIRALAVMLYPYVPQTAGQIWSQLGEKKELGAMKWSKAGALKAGQALGEVKILHRKIEESELANFGKVQKGEDKGEKTAEMKVEKTEEVKAEKNIEVKIEKKEEHKKEEKNETRVEENKEEKDEKEKNSEKKAVDGVITYNEFSNVHMVVGLVKTAEKVEKSNKLVKMTVDLGDEERQIVAGILNKYTAQELVGKKIIVVENLQPAKLMGVDSNGMLLAAENGADLVLLTVDKDIAPGAKIC